MSVIAGKDPSSGTKDEIYNMKIRNRKATDAHLCPPGLLPEDRDEFFEHTLDVVALPGTPVAARAFVMRTLPQNFWMC